MNQLKNVSGTEEKSKLDTAVGSVNGQSKYVNLPSEDQYNSLDINPYLIANDSCYLLTTDKTDL